MKKILLTLMTSLSLALSGPVALAPVYAAGSAPKPAAAAATTPCPKSNDPNLTAEEQVKVGIGATGSDCSGSGVTKFVATIVTILSIVAGIAGIIMIIIAGFKYMTSGGDSGKVSSAKSTLIYAMIGLLVAALAQLLVRFVLHEATSV